MFIRTTCPICKAIAYRNVVIEGFQNISFSTDDELHKYTLENIHVDQAILEKIFIGDILPKIKMYIHNGMTIHELFDVFKNIFAVSAEYCPYLFEAVKQGLNLTCTDKKVYLPTIPL